MCVLAHRNVVSANAIAALEARCIDTVLGARERSTSEVGEVMLTDRRPMVSPTVPRARSSKVDIGLKEVIVGDWGPGKPRRHLARFNSAAVRRDTAARRATATGLCTKLKAGDKEVVGATGYRRFLATLRDRHFEKDAARVVDDARCDGLHVLRTNSALNTLSVALAYCELWRIEAIFRTAKSILETRPIFHQSDAAIANASFR
jgi:hypothetical protein